MSDTMLGILQRYDKGKCSASVALMEMLIATEDAHEVESFLASALPSAVVGCKQLQLLFRSNAAGCHRIATMLAADVDRPPVGATVKEGVEFCRKLFDWSVEQNEASSVALYSLGNPTLLAMGTNEIVSQLLTWNLLGPQIQVLDIGCGTGRIEVAVAPHVHRIHGIDVSDRMLEVARRACADLVNVDLTKTLGLNLDEFEQDEFDLVIAVDSFPYVFQAGWPLVEKLFHDAHRVLRDSGNFVIFNFSYRNDLDADIRDAAEVATAAGFNVRVNGASPFGLWNGQAFWFNKSSAKLNQHV